MTEKKYCQCCGILISDINEADSGEVLRSLPGGYEEL